MSSVDFLGQGMVAGASAPSPGECSQEAVADGPLFRRSGWAAVPVCILPAPTWEGDGAVGTTQRRVSEAMAGRARPWACGTLGVAWREIRAAVEEWRWWMITHP